MPALRNERPGVPARPKRATQRDLPQMRVVFQTSPALDVPERPWPSQTREPHLPHRPGATARQAHPRNRGAVPLGGSERIGDVHRRPHRHEGVFRRFVRRHHLLARARTHPRRSPRDARDRQSAGRRGMGDSPGAHQLRTRGNARGASRSSTRSNDVDATGRKTTSGSTAATTSIASRRKGSRSRRTTTRRVSNQASPTVIGSTRAKPSTSAALVRAESSRVRAELLGPCCRWAEPRSEPGPLGYTFVQEQPPPEGDSRGCITGEADGVPGALGD